MQIETKQIVRNTEDMIVIINILVIKSFVLELLMMFIFVELWFSIIAVVDVRLYFDVNIYVEKKVNVDDGINESIFE